MTAQPFLPTFRPIISTSSPSGMTVYERDG
jgi:hypothetical protein